MNSDCTTALRRAPLLYPHLFWNGVAARFPSDFDCIASFFAFQAAEVLVGVKPANTINLVNRDKACGRRPYALWRSHGERLLLASGLEAVQLCDRGESLQLLIYRREHLEAVVQRPSVRRLLQRTGYPVENGLDAVLAELVGRVGQGSFPHEIGLILGYPVKDVGGFMGLVPLPLTHKGPWKIYGRAEPSLRLAEAHRQGREQMVRRLAEADCPLDCLRGAAADC